MLDLVRDIDSLTNFKRQTSKFINQMKKSGAPKVLTVNGKAELVVQDAKAYQKLLDLLDRAEMIAGIRRGLNAVPLGKGRAADDVLEKMRMKHKIPKKS